MIRTIMVKEARCPYYPYRVMLQLHALWSDKRSITILASQKQIWGAGEEIWWLNISLYTSHTLGDTNPLLFILLFGPCQSCMVWVNQR
jgi:hypothetical protein